MKKFISQLLKFSALIILTVVISFAYYFYSDPFKIIKTYSDFSYPAVVPNRDFVSTQAFKNKFDKYHYNSFIFGSSRTMGLDPKSWSKYLDTISQPFMFDASGESLDGIYLKIKYLDARHVKMDNVIILLCRDNSFLNTINNTGHLIIKHPETSGKSKFKFHLNFIEAYYDNKFLIRFLVYKLTGQYKPWMKGYIEYRGLKFDTITNQMSVPPQDKELEENQNKYYEDRVDVFYIRSKERKDSVRRIEPNHINVLTEIKTILEKNKTNYKIILSPLYEQVKYNSQDLIVLKSLFGKNLYDYSGKNKYTDDKTNYYEWSHFRPNVGDSIFSEIYHKQLY